MQNNIVSTKTTLSSKSSISPIKTKVNEEQNSQFDNHTNSNSLSSSNFNLSDNNIQLKETESSGKWIHFYQIIHISFNFSKIC